MRQLMIALVLASFATAALAQDPAPAEGWQNEFSIGLNMLQSSYSQNWNGGDKGSINWNGTFDAKMERQYTSRNWRNTLKLAYGQSHKQERDGSDQLYWQKPDKTDDIIDFESLLRFTQHSGWDPYVAVNAKSKFDDRSDSAGRGIMFNPVTVSPSAGIARKLVNTEDRSLLARLGVAWIYNSRSFFLNPAPDTATQRESSNEFAAEAVFEYKVGALDKRVDWESKLTLLLPFVYSGKSVFEDDLDLAAEGLPDDVAGYTTTLDVDWENTFTANITSLIAVKLFVRWVYDKYDNTVSPVVENGTLTNAADVHNAIRKAGQFKQTLALGMTYKF
jgi:opacity protein-like surface antigen